MARWLVQLHGSSEDLEEFAAWFPSGEVHALPEGNAVFLVGAHLKTQTEASQVGAFAEQAIDELFAVVSLLSPVAQRPSTGSVFYEDDEGNRQEHHTSKLDFVVKLRGRVRGGVGETQAQLLLAGSRGVPSLRNALLLWADPHKTWPRLYRILEEVETYLGTTVNKAGMCTEPQRKRFTQTANTAEVAGKDSRHAAGKFSPPKSPMSIREATSFVSGLLQASLRKAAGL